MGSNPLSATSPSSQKPLAGQPTKDFRWLLAAQFIAQVADGWAQGVFADILLLEPRGDEGPAQFLALFALTLVPYSLINPFVGVFVDRWPRRRLMVAANLIRVPILGGLALFAADTWEIPFYASLLVILALGRLLLTTKGALLPVVVPEGRLLSANSLSAGGGMVSTIVGGTAGIGVVALAGAEVAFFVGGLLYLVAAFVSGRLSDPFAHPHGHATRMSEAIRDVIGDVGRGIRSVVSKRSTRVALESIGLLRTSAMFVAIAAIISIKASTENTGGRLTASALALGAAGVGAFGGAIASPVLGRRIGRNGLIVMGIVISGFAMLGLGGLSGRPAIIALTAATGFGTLIGKIAVDATLQVALEDELRGRGFAIYDAVFNLATVVAAALMVVLEPLGLATAVVSMGGATIGAGAFLAWRLTSGAAQQEVVQEGR